MLWILLETISTIKYQLSTRLDCAFKFQRFFFFFFFLSAWTVKSHEFTVQRQKSLFTHLKILKMGYMTLFTHLKITLLPYFQFQCFFFFFSKRMNIKITWIYCAKTKITVHAFKNIKNGFHGTIHTFKNYFANVFSVLITISLIQTDPKYQYYQVLNKDYNWFSNK